MPFRGPFSQIKAVGVAEIKEETKMIEEIGEIADRIVKEVEEISWRAGSLDSPIKVVIAMNAIVVT